MPFKCRILRRQHRKLELLQTSPCPGSKVQGMENGDEKGKGGGNEAARKNCLLCFSRRKINVLRCKVEAQWRKKTVVGPVSDTGF